MSSARPKYTPARFKTRKISEAKLKEIMSWATDIMDRGPVKLPEAMTPDELKAYIRQCIDLELYQEAARAQRLLDKT